MRMNLRTKEYAYLMEIYSDFNSLPFMKFLDIMAKNKST